MAIPFKKADASVVQEAYQSPSSAERADPEMVAAFKGMQVGEAIEITQEAIGRQLPRSVKITVGKAAKEAGWKLNYRNHNGGFLAKIVGPVTNGESNGTVEASVDESEESQNGASEEAPAATTGNGRRNRG